MRHNINKDQKSKAKKVLSENILGIRSELGLSQREISNRASMSRSYFSEVERGTREPSLQTLECMADALGVEVWQLVKPYELHEIKYLCSKIQRDLKP